MVRKFGQKSEAGERFELDPATLNSLKEVISLNWVGDEKLTSEFKAPISKAVAWFLSSEKNSKLQPTDPVAKFHLGNGASLLRVNWPADASQNGLDGSFCAMVNYKYSLDEIERNHERFVESGEVEISNESAKLAKDFNKALNIV